MGWRNQGWLCTAPQPGALWQALCSSGDEGWEWAAAGRGQIPATIHLLPANLEKDKTTPIFQQHCATVWAGHISHRLALPYRALRCFWLLQSLSSLICSLKGSLAGSGEVHARDPSALRVHLSCPAHTNL